MFEEKVIRMEIPSDKKFSRILRLAAAGAADTCGFDMDMIEDVKVIVSEVFSSAMEAGCGGVKLGMKPEKGRLTVHFGSCDGKSVLKGANEMTLPILEALAGEVSVEEDGSLTLIIE
jgi:serine/threonine-protein kinase RsbW